MYFSNTARDVGTHQWASGLKGFESLDANCIKAFNKKVLFSFVESSAHVICCAKTVAIKVGSDVA